MLTSDISPTKQPREIKKKANRSRMVRLSCTIFKIYEYALSPCFFSSFPAKGTLKMWNTLSEHRDIIEGTSGPWACPSSRQREKISRTVRLCPIAHAHSGREREAGTGGELEKVFARFEVTGHRNAPKTWKHRRGGKGEESFAWHIQKCNCLFLKYNVYITDCEKMRCKREYFPGSDFNFYRWVQI